MAQVIRQTDQAVFHPLKKLPIHTIVQLISGEIVYICHKTDEDICVVNTKGDHWDELPLAMARVVKLPTDLCRDYMDTMPLDEA